jgi:hypothetical protein
MVAGSRINIRVTVGAATFGILLGLFSGEGLAK